MQKELRSDANYDVYVYATVRPQGSDQDIKLRLHGGSFQAVERHLELRQLVIGSGKGEDISCHAMETIRIPLQAGFTGYSPGNPDHRRLITAFKDSCRLVGVQDNDRQLDASASIQWTKAEEGPQPVLLARRLRAVYARRHRAAPRWNSAEKSRSTVPMAISASVRTTNCRLLAREPRFKLKVQEITPRTEKLLFDSERLVSGRKPTRDRPQFLCDPIAHSPGLRGCDRLRSERIAQGHRGTQMPASFGELRGEDVREGGGIRERARRRPNSSSTIRRWSGWATTSFR